MGRFTEIARRDTQRAPMQTLESAAIRKVNGVICTVLEEGDVAPGGFVTLQPTAG